VLNSAILKMASGNQDARIECEIDPFPISEWIQEKRV